jgi:hypothetical protein
MQKLTGKEIVVRKSELKALLADALCFHDLCEGFRQRVAEDQKSAIWFAFLAGVRLLQIKPSIPTGDWMTWVEFNFCAPRGISDREARRYIQIANEQAKLIPKINWTRVSKGEVDYELVAQFKFDSIRKYSITFVEEKSQPEHEDNFKFPRLASMINIVNEFERVFSRHVDGLQLMDLDEVREDTVPLYRFLKCIHETPDVSPFVA